MPEPCIIIRLNEGRANDGMHIVKGLIHNDVKRIVFFDAHGQHSFYEVAALHYLTRNECMFFRGSTAELLYLIHFVACKWINDQWQSITKTSKWMGTDEVEKVVPPKLWSDKYHANA